MSHPIVSILLCSTLALLPFDEPEEKAIARLKTMKWVDVLRDDEKPGRPVLEVRLCSDDVTNATLSELKHFKRLRNLSINRTAITDEGMKIVAGLQTLEEVTLSSNRLADATVGHVAELKNLKSLALIGGSFTDASLAKLRGTGIKSLSLSGESFTDQGLAHLGELRHLEDLRLGGAHVTGAGLKGLRLTKLRSLDLTATKVSDATLEALQDLVGLRSLGLGHTAVTGSGFPELKQLQELEELWLCNTKVADAELAHLKALPKLKKLYLQSTKVTDAGMKHLRELSNIELLDLDDTDVTDEADAALEKALPTLAAGRAKDREEWAKLNKREQKDSGIPDADARAILDEIIRHVLTGDKVKSTREFYGKPGDKRLGLASDSPIKWPKDYVPAVKGYEYQYIAEGRYPVRNDCRKPPLLGIRVNELTLDRRRADPFFGGPISVTVYRIAGHRDVIGGCTIYYSAEKTDGKWTVNYTAAFDP